MERSSRRSSHNSKRKQSRVLGQRPELWERSQPKIGLLWVCTSKSMHAGIGARLHWDSQMLPQVQGMAWHLDVRSYLRIIQRVIRYWKLFIIQYLMALITVFNICWILDFSLKQKWWVSNLQLFTTWCPDLAQMALPLVRGVSGRPEPSGRIVLFVHDIIFRRKTL